MKVRFEAQKKHLDALLKKYGVESVSREWCKYLIPDPTKRVELDKYPRLKIISTPSTGTNHIDLDECERRGIKVLSLLDDREGLDEIKASSEFAFFLILSALRLGGFRMWRKYLRNDEVMMGRELHGKFVGIVGYGRIGCNVGEYLNAFGAKWVHYDRHLGQERLNGIFSDCDIVLVSMNLNEETRGMIDKKLLGKLKRGAILVNIARAEIINEADLLEWVRAERGIYASDVLHREVDGLHLESELLHRANCIITPHIGGHTYESTRKAAEIALRLLKREINE